MGSAHDPHVGPGHYGAAAIILPKCGGGGPSMILTMAPRARAPLAWYFSRYPALRLAHLRAGATFSHFTEAKMRLATDMRCTSEGPS